MKHLGTKIIEINKKQNVSYSTTNIHFHLQNSCTYDYFFGQKNNVTISPHDLISSGSEEVKQENGIIFTIFTLIINLITIHQTCCKQITTTEIKEIKDAIVNLSTKKSILIV